MIDLYIEQLINNSTPEKPMWNQEMIIQGKNNHWNYIDGCMMTAFLELYNDTNNKKYLDFVDNFVGYYINDNGHINTYNIQEYNLDNINMGRSLFKLYELTGKDKYRKAIDYVYEQILTQPRTKEGNFWHKLIYPGQVWLDGLYMAQPFYLEYEKKFNNKRNYNDVLNQIVNVADIMRDKVTGLYYHGYDSSRVSFWCNKDDGLSQNFWLRSLGWFLMALVDVIEILDDNEKLFKNQVTLILNSFIDSIINYQDSSGMWFQVINKPESLGNYLETSGTAIISYAILKAVNLKIISDKYKDYGLKAFSGICKKYLRNDKGDMVLGGTCLVAGLGGKDRRDGSYNYYISEPVVENEAKGIAPFILAYIYKKKFD